MNNQNTCPTCGSPIDSTMKFCRMCGGDLRANSAQPMPTAAPVADPDPTCPTCGTPSRAGQKFCAKCGATLGAGAPPRPTPIASDAAPGSAPNPNPQPAPKPAEKAGEAAVVAGAAVATAADSLGDIANRSKSALDDFMGRSVDTAHVGADFNPRAHTLQTAGDAGLKAAFNFFQKPYKPAAKDEGAQPLPNVVRRAKAEEEMRAQEQAKRDFSKTSGEGAHYGSFAASLSDAAMPTIDMIAGSRAKAAKNEQLNRLKHQVAMGETTMAEAVKQA